MQVIASSLDGVRVIVPAMRHDARGVFFEAWHATRYREVGLPGSWAQCNVSHSNQGVLRGLHLQHPLAQAKLVTVLAGRIFDVAVDVRRGSSTYAQWFGTELSGENGHQLFVPDGFAHGFLVLSPFAVVMYLTTSVYEPSSELVIHWNDPTIRVQWPEPPKILADRDRAAPRLAELADRLPVVTH